MSEPKTRGFWRWVKRLVGALVVLALLGAAGVAATFWYFSRGLPSVEELRTWRPPQVTKVYCQGGVVCAEYFRERRTWVDVSTVPPHVKNAFLAAEDADFYQHEGLDYVGMVRAGLMSLVPGKHMTGASTISQQACRNILLSQERTLVRKIREWILTPRMEKALSKDEILNLYVNTIYFGHERYGYEEAALFYFGKHAKDLSLGEAAVLAGTVQSPNRINPVTSIERAKKRQRYVLTQLSKHGFVPLPATSGELDKPIQLGPRPPAPVGQYYAEEIRKQLVERYGEKAVLESGLKVTIAMDVKLQAAAEASVRAGLEALDRRQGYRGAAGTLDPARFQALRPLLETRLKDTGKRKGDEAYLADLAGLKETPPAAGAEENEEEQPEDEPLPSEDQKRVAQVPLKPLHEGVEAVGFVEASDDKSNVATVDLVGRKAAIAFSTVSWARMRSPEGKLGAMPVRISDVIKPGELVRVKVTKVTPEGTPLEATLAQVPAVQGALLAIDPPTRTVVAMVGGYDFTTSAFNRATQAHRQPGSSFKPFVYGAAIASGKYTPVSVVNDAPETIRDPYTGKPWRPQNFEKGGYDGPMTLRLGLTHSKNTISVRLIQALTPPVVTDFANKAGVKSPMPDNFTEALGTGEVTMLEIANAYATLHSLGRYADPVMLVKVQDAAGKTLEEHHAAFEEVLPPAVAYLDTSLMRSVVGEGTAPAV